MRSINFNGSLAALTLLSTGLLLGVQQSEADTSTLSELSAAHERVLDEPGNVEFLYEYAQQAIRLGNYEAAIGALEGILVMHGDHPGLLLQIGSLYQRLDAPRTARSYLERARKHADKGSDVAAASRRLLDSINERISDHTVSGFVRSGLRYQSNPARSPESSEILSSGFRVPTPESRRPEADVNAFMLSRVEHRYRLDRRLSTVSDAIFYGTVYEDQDRLNYALLELSTGVEYKSPASASGRYSLRPYLLYRAAYMKDYATEGTPGAGLEYQLRPDANSRFRAGYEYRDNDLEDDVGFGSASLRNGAEHRLDLRYLWELEPGHAVSVRAFARSRDAQREYFELEEWSLGAAYSARVANRLFSNRPDMTLTPYVQRRVQEFGAPDVRIDPTQTRKDREWRAGLSVQVPMSESVSLYLNYEHSDVNSNILNFDSDNDLIVVGLQAGF